MNEKEFYKAVEASILQFMPEGYEDAKARVEEVTKPGDIKLHGLSINKGDMATCPLLYLEDYYKRIEDGYPFETVLVLIAAQYDNILQQYPGLTVPDLDYDKIKGNLRVRLLYAKDNQELLKVLYGFDVGCGYVLTIYADLSEKFAEGAVANIKKDMIRSFGYSEEQLIKDALEDAVINAPAKLTNLESELFGKITGNNTENLLELTELDDQNRGILVLSTEDRYCGAAALFYPGVMDRIGELLQGSYYILPSSVHELLICPDDGRFNANDLANIVGAVNNAQVAKEEQLGDRVLYYNAMTRELSVAMDLDREKEDDLELG